MKVLVNAISAKMGGAQAYLKNFLPALSSMGLADEFTVIVPAKAAPELRRWANLRLIPLYCVAYRESDALEVGRKWLEAHPDSPLALNVRAVMASIATRHRHEAFPPSRSSNAT